MILIFPLCENDDCNENMVSPTDDELAVMIPKIKYR